MSIPPVLKAEETITEIVENFQFKRLMQELKILCSKKDKVLTPNEIMDELSVNYEMAHSLHMGIEKDIKDRRIREIKNMAFDKS